MTLKRKPNRQQISQNTSIPAPVGGLNARDAVAAMPVTDAVLMDNWFPEPSDVRLRQGYIDQSTGLPDWVETLMQYNGDELFAISNGNIYNATISGAVGAPVVTGLINSRWQYTNIGTAGGQFIYAVNGADDPLLYNGTTWTPINGASTPAITGVTTNKLIHVNLYKNRIWFTEEDSFRVWYLPVSSVGGAAQSIDFSSLFKLGGYLMGMITVTIDNSGGIDEYAAFVSSEGEIALYRGNDPTSPSTFQITGFFRIGRPIGRRFFAKVGSDVVLLTADGFIQISKALLTDRSQRQDALSYKIVNLVSNDVRNYSGNFGWQPLLHPLGNKLIFNIPQIENTVQYQYVLNTISGAWCRFTGWNSACWELFQDEIYFGGDQMVGKADFGNDDNGSAIVGDVGQAFSYFGVMGKNKRWTMVRPIMNSNGTLNLSLGLNVDFANEAPSSTPSFSTGGSTPWYSPWYSPWSSAYDIKKDWQTVTGLGFAAALRMRVAGLGITARWQATDFVYEVGGIL